MNKDQKQKLVDSYKSWWHSIYFGDGVWSDGWKAVELPKDKRMNKEIISWGLTEEFFKGKDVLDIGAWDGFFSFYAEGSLAKSVTALDGHIWDENIKSWASKEGFDIAKKIFKSRVKDVTMDIMDATPEVLGKFDIILFAGVFYHLDHPYKCLQILDSLINHRGIILIETHYLPDFNNIPIMQFHPKDTLNGDGTNTWSPNEKCLTAMMNEIGGYRLIKNIKTEADRIVHYYQKVG